MDIQFLGAARTVTGSMHLLRTAAGNILVDCGMFQGRREESRERNRNLPKEAITADVLLLSHAHIDHSGNVPTLVKRGFEGAVYCTPATRDLCACMLRDSARIQQADADFLNEKHADDPEWQAIEPLYDEEDAVHAMSHFITLAYGRRFQVLPGVTVSFIDAGHILGSAEILVEVVEGGETRRILFSGDLGRKNLPILRDPEIPKGRIDYMLLESTYGDRVHDDVATALTDLERVIKETIARKGKVIVPSFSVGRTQELVYALHQLREAGRLPAVPIYVDSPLSTNVTEVFKLHPECYDEETKQFLEEHGEVFDFRGIRYVSSRADSMKLNDLREPAIIIAASGMCEAGRILHHLRNNIEVDKNTILIVGFQAEHTLGRRLVERRPRVKIFGMEHERRARVEILNAFSAHADRDDLVEFATTCGRQARKIFLVHGEPAQQDALRDNLAGRGLKVHVPERGETVALD